MAYKRHVEYVERLLTTGDNAERVAVVSALGVFTEMLNEATFSVSSGRSLKDRIETALRGSCVARRVTPRQLLVRVLGLLLFLSAHPGTFGAINDSAARDRCVRYALALCVLRTTGTSPTGTVRIPGSMALNALGDTVQKGTARVFALCVVAVEEGKRRASDPNRPFDPVVIGRSSLQRQSA
ncbi:MAG: hypothetical protein ABI782_07965 [Anaerolineaceae bacterium]